MSRSDAEPNFDDALGSRVRWSLRRIVVHAAPSAELWRRIQQQAYTGEVDPRHLAARRRGLSGRPGQLWRAACRLLDLGAQTLHLLDEHTMSSEMIWRPVEQSDACYRLIIARANSWPLFGQRLPIF